MTLKINMMRQICVGPIIIVVPVGSRGAIFSRVSKIWVKSYFSGSDKKIFAQNQNYLGSAIKNLGKIRNFRAATVINCRKYLPNLGKDFFSFFSENTMILEQKLRNLILISSEKLFFFGCDPSI